MNTVFIWEKMFVITFMWKGAFVNANGAYSLQPLKRMVEIFFYNFLSLTAKARAPALMKLASDVWMHAMVCVVEVLKVFPRKANVIKMKIFAWGVITLACARTSCDDKIISDAFRAGTLLDEEFSGCDNYNYELSVYETKAKHKSSKCT